MGTSTGRCLLIGMCRVISMLMRLVGNIAKTTGGGLAAANQQRQRQYNG